MRVSINRVFAADKIVQRLTALRANGVVITVLSLSNNGLGFISNADIERILAAIPDTVELLDLSNNNLCMKSSEAMQQVFAAIPSHINSLHIYKNSLMRTYKSRLAEMIKAIPATVKSIKMWEDHREYNCDVRHLVEFRDVVGAALVGFEGRMMRDLDTYLSLYQQSPILKNGIFVDLPYYFHPQDSVITKGSAFRVPFFRAQLPLLFRPLRYSLDYDLPLNVVEKVYAYLSYREICKLALAKTISYEKPGM